MFSSFPFKVPVPGPAAHRRDSEAAPPQIADVSYRDGASLSDAILPEPPKPLVQEGFCNGLQRRGCELYPQL